MDNSALTHTTTELERDFAQNSISSSLLAVTSDFTLQHYPIRATTGADSLPSMAHLKPARALWTSIGLPFSEAQTLKLSTNPDLIIPSSFKLGEAAQVGFFFTIVVLYLTH